MNIVQPLPPPFHTGAAVFTSDLCLPSLLHSVRVRVFSCRCFLQRLLRGAETERPEGVGTGAGAGTEVSGAGQEESGAVTLPLWVQVTKKGLETRIVFHGEWVFTNHLPQEVQVRQVRYSLCPAV